MADGGRIAARNHLFQGFDSPYRECVANLGIGSHSICVNTVLPGGGSSLGQWCKVRRSVTGTGLWLRVLGPDPRGPRQTRPDALRHFILEALLDAADISGVEVHDYRYFPDSYPCVGFSDDQCSDIACPANEVDGEQWSKSADGELHSPPCSAAAVVAATPSRQQRYFP